MQDINEASRTSNSKLRGRWSVLVTLASCSTADNDGNRPISIRHLCSDVPGNVARIPVLFSVGGMMMVEGPGQTEASWRIEGVCM